METPGGVTLNEQQGKKKKKHDGNQERKKKIHLGLDVDFGFGVFGEPGHVDLTVKVSNVADDGVVLHVLKVAEGQSEDNVFNVSSMCVTKWTRRR